MIQSHSSLITPTQPAPTRIDSQLYGRFYQVEGQPEPFPSVTHVLSCLGKPALINWAASEERKLMLDAAADLYQDAHGTPLMLRAVYTDTLLKRVTKVKAHQKQLAKAGEVGTQVHHMAEWWLRRGLGQEAGPQPPLSPEAAVAFGHFQEWAATVHLQPLFLEHTVWSVRHRYAGTLDVLGYVDGKLTVIDFKTSSALYPEYDLQVAAYVQAMREMGKGEVWGRVARGMLVRFPKKATDTFEVRDVHPWAPRFREFLKVRAMFDVWYGWERAYQDKRAAEKAARVAV